MGHDNRAIVLLSGGLDSSTLVAEAVHAGYAVHALSTDYGQRHVRELQAAAAIARHFGVRHTTVDLGHVGRLLGGSALTDPRIPVPDGHYAAETMQATVVPNRNAILLAVAFGVAVAEQARRVGTAVHAGDHAIYPDCRPAFINAFGAMQRLATEGFADPALHIWTPYVRWTKTDIARRAAELGVPIGETWSCYKGARVHCGTCGTCVERREAFAQAGVPDPTVYAAGVPA